MHLPFKKKKKKGGKGERGKRKGKKIPLILSWWKKVNLLQLLFNLDQWTLKQEPMPNKSHASYRGRARPNGGVSVSESRFVLIDFSSLSVPISWYVRWVYEFMCEHTCTVSIQYLHTDRMRLSVSMSGIQSKQQPPCCLDALHVA